jgi:putative ABC transport system permease protein
MILALRSALRSLGRAPGFAALVIGTLAIGIGGSAAIFSLVNALLLRPLPFPDEERLVRMRDEITRPGEGSWRYNTSPRSYVALRERSGVFDGVVAQRYRPMILGAPGEPQRVIGIGVSEGWAEVLGVGPVLGRTFTAEETAQGTSAGVALIGHALWQSRFGGEPGVLGRGIVLDDEVYTVIGVMPRAYNYPYGAELWVPDRFDRDDVRFGPYVVGRLRPDYPAGRAQRELDGLSATLSEEYPESHASIRLLAVPFRDDLVSNHPRVGVALLLGSGILLLLACFNIANLQLVRGSAREAERAVRAALGAGSRHQIGHALAESGLLALAGSAGGLLVADALHGAMAGLGVRADASLGAFFTDLSVDWRVAAFALAVGAGTAIISGVVPALRAGRVDPRSVLAGAGRGATGGSGRVMDGLVAAELAVALVLLSGATLMAANTSALLGGERGYAVAERMTFRVGLASRAGADSARVVYVDRLLERLRADAGVVAVGAAHHLPMDDGSSSTSFSVAGGPFTEGDRRLLANVRIVAGEYFDAIGMPIEEGRAFLHEELRGGRDVVIVNRAFADRYLGGDALGRRLTLGALAEDRPWLTVVGVAGTADENIDLRESLYIPYGQTPSAELAIVAAGAGVTAARLRAAVRDVDPGQPLHGLATLDTRIRDRLAAQTTATRLMIGFAAFGLLLATLGIYGVMAFMVRGRRRELAVRRALGLTATGAFLRVLKRSAALAGIGIGAGLPVALFFNRVLTDVLGGAAQNVSLDIRLVAEHATLSTAGYAAIAAVVLALALAAAALPAARAAAVHPAGILREGG